RRVGRRPAELQEQTPDRPRRGGQRGAEQHLAGDLDGQRERKGGEDEVHEPVVGEEVHLVERVLGRAGRQQAPGDVGEREVLRVVDARQEPRNEQTAHRQPDRAEEQRGLDPPKERPRIQRVPSSGTRAVSNARYAPWCERRRTASASPLKTRLRTRGSPLASVGTSSGVLTMTSGNARAY